MYLNAKALLSHSVQFDKTATNLSSTLDISGLHYQIIKSLIENWDEKSFHSSYHCFTAEDSSQKVFGRRHVYDNSCSLAEVVANRNVDRRSKEYANDAEVSSISEFCR